MNDGFVLCEDAVEAKNLLPNMNFLHKDIGFNMESVSDGKLTFFDVLIERRPDGFILHTIYPEATWTDQYFLPKIYKKDLVINLLRPRKKSSFWSQIYSALTPTVKIS